MGVDPPHLLLEPRAMGLSSGGSWAEASREGDAPESRGACRTRRRSPLQADPFPRTANVYLHLLGAGYSTSTIAFRDARAGSWSGPAS